MRKKGYILILFGVLMLSAITGFAQHDSVAKATVILQDQSMPADTRIKRAAEIIDKAINHPECINDGYAWYIRGFIYKEWYKTLDSQNKKSRIRVSSIDYLKKSLSLFSTDTSSSAKEYGAAIKKTLKYISSTLYNDAGTSLDAANYPTAIENYEKYKECTLAAEPNYNLKPKELEFKVVLADVYSSIFRSDLKANTQFYGMAEQTYKQVIAIDTNNWGANYNLAMLYYNYGVDLINNMSVTEDLVVIDNIQEESRVLFKKALPYALKAYQLKPDRKAVLVCLQGIYFSLYEFEKSDEFKAKIASLGTEK